MNVNMLQISFDNVIVAVNYDTNINAMLYSLEPMLQKV